jgi:hypothetical protein
MQMFQVPSPPHWQMLATACARFAFEREFDSRRGCYPIELERNGVILVLFNNNPYAAGKHFRNEELRRVRQRLNQLGIAELGYGVWPTKGKQVGYSYALLLDRWSPQMQAAVIKAVEEETNKTTRALLEEVNAATS